MITRTAPWKNALADLVRDPAELLELLDLPPSMFEGLPEAGADFSLRVTRPFLARIEKGNPDDPLLRQILPQGIEQQTATGFGPDPVGDGRAAREPGLLHKYHGRVLLVTTGACPIHCRYCFRRHFPYADANPSQHQWQAALKYLRTDPTVHELILSGGDPLMLDEAKLSPLVEGLASIPHLKRLRIHTRMPVALPERVDQALLDWLQGLPLKTVMVIHSNHPAEIDATVEQALTELHKAGVTLLNQAVLLRGVNDELDTLCTLSERLFEAHTLPYYLHLLDRVAGAAHFEVPESELAGLIQGLRERLPGYLVPKLVREVAGEAYKIPQQL